MTYYNSDPKPPKKEKKKPQPLKRTAKKETDICDTPTNFKKKKK